MDTVEFMQQKIKDVGIFEKDPVKPLKFYIVDIKDNKKDMELKGLKVRLR